MEVEEVEESAHTTKEQRDKKEREREREKERNGNNKKQKKKMSVREGGEGECWTWLNFAATINGVFRSFLKKIKYKRQRDSRMDVIV